MSWARGDDRYDDTRKIKRAWRMSGYAVGLHWMAVTASARHETDGLVDPEWLAERLAIIPKGAAKTAIDTLVSVGLFDPLPAGESRTLTDEQGYEATVGPLDEDAYIVHDFLDYNASSTQKAEKRAEDSKRKRTGRGKDSKPSPDGVRTDSERSPRGVHADSDGSPDVRGRAPAPAALPGPSRPALKGPPSPPDGGRARDHKGWKNEAVKYARLAGVDGDEETLCRAVEQATSFVKLKSPEEFRTFAAQHFESLTVEVAAA